MGRYFAGWALVVRRGAGISGQEDILGRARRGERGGSLVEITINTIQGRYLLRPDQRGRVNELVLGVVGRAQRLYSMSIVGISVLSSHAHVLAVPLKMGPKEVLRAATFRPPYWSLCSGRCIGTSWIQ